MTKGRGWGVVAIALLGGVVLATPPRPVASTPGLEYQQRFRGHVRASRQVELQAPFEEILSRVEVDEGTTVAEGELLALLDDRLQVSVVAAARLGAESEAAVLRADLDLEDARVRLCALVAAAFGRKAATDFELRQARIATRRAEALRTEAVENQSLARVNLELETRRLERYHITAPFDGIVTRVHAERGAMLTEEDTILELVDLDTLEAHINVPAALYGKLVAGSTYTLVAEAPVNGELAAALASVEPLIDTASQTFRCVFEIDNEQAQWPAGFTVSLTWPSAAVAPAIVQGADDREQD